jgi:alpha-glucosidase
MGDPWWRSAVVYQIYPRSFADSNGDGHGDLEGIREHLDHLQWLGVDALWISPFYPSPMLDGGYDVMDYCNVDPRFGTLEDFDRLLSDLHERGMRLLVDWVPNHTSDRHPWFVESRASRDSPKRAWFIWRDQPNNWRAAIGGGSAWTLDEPTDQYYLHFFLPEQPDLNWTEPQVVEAMHGTLRFWLDRGVDGFRIDAAHCIGKDPTFADDPRCFAGIPMADFNDQPASHEVLRGVRRLVDSYEGNRVTVGEVNIQSTERVMTYYGSGDELHLSFNFPPLHAPWDAVVWQSVINEVEHHLPEAAWPTWVLSNHDNRRHRTRYGGSLPRARAAAVLLLTLRGTPFIYQGEELGLLDVELLPHDWVDPGGRDGPRAPIPWEPEWPFGWRGERPYLPFPPEAAERNVEVQRADPDSIAHLYRDLIAVRRASPALSGGDWEPVKAPKGVIGFRRSTAGDQRVILVNFAGHTEEIPVDGDWLVELASDRIGEGGKYGGLVRGDAAVILRPS